MRTTVDLPSAVHRRARDLAQRRGQSLSAVVAELTIRGLAQLDEPVELTIEAGSGFPIVRVGRKVTSDEVARVLDDE